MTTEWSFEERRQIEGKPNEQNLKRFSQTIRERTHVRHSQKNIALITAFVWITYNQKPHATTDWLFSNHTHARKERMCKNVFFSVCYDSNCVLVLIFDFVQHFLLGWICNRPAGVKERSSRWRSRARRSMMLEREPPGGVTAWSLAVETWAGPCSFP